MVQHFSFYVTASFASLLQPEAPEAPEASETDHFLRKTSRGYAALFAVKLSFTGADALICPAAPPPAA